MESSKNRISSDMSDGTWGMLFASGEGKVLIDQQLSYGMR
jgi:hypothetical protein